MDSVSLHYVESQIACLEGRAARVVRPVRGDDSTCGVDDPGDICI